MARPSRAWPFMPLMAACASGSEPISTKPKPFERPVSRSIMTFAELTVPYCANACCRSSSRMLYERLPTYSLLPMGELPSCSYRDLERLPIVNHSSEGIASIHRLANISELGEKNEKVGTHLLLFGMSPPEHSERGL